LGLKILKFFDADPRIRNLFDPRSGIRDKHPGSATLFRTRNVSVSQSHRSVFQNRIRVSRFHSVCSFNQALLAPNNRKVNILLQLLGYSTGTVQSLRLYSVLEFLNNLWGLGTE
jgi:hypothetical protein